jgi:hypothetical protein
MHALSVETKGAYRRSIMHMARLQGRTQPGHRPWKQEENGWWERACLGAPGDWEGLCSCSVAFALLYQLGLRWLRAADDAARLGLPAQSCNRSTCSGPPSGPWKLQDSACMHERHNEKTHTHMHEVSRVVLTSVNVQCTIFSHNNCMPVGDQHLVLLWQLNHIHSRDWPLVEMPACWQGRAEGGRPVGYMAGLSQAQELQRHLMCCHSSSGQGC